MSAVRLLLIAAFVSFSCGIAAGQDALTIASTSALAGETVRLPVSISDAGGTLLDGGVSGRRIQGIAFRLSWAPAQLASVSFVRGGVLQGRAPLYERLVHAGGSLGYIVSFSEESGPLPFSPNATRPGDPVGTLEVVLQPSLTPGTVVPLTLDILSTVLSNSDGSVFESVYNGQLTPVSGSIGIGGATTTTVLTSSPAPSIPGETVTLTASVTSPFPGNIGGTVKFFEGSTSVGAATVENSAATLALPSLAVGVHPFTAVYEGDATHLTSTSSVHSHTVMQAEVGINVAFDAPLQTTEAGGTATIRMRLTSPPLAQVRIGISSSDPGEGNVSTAALRFTPENWRLEQAIIVTGVDDPSPDGDVVYRIVTAPAVSDDPAYAGLNPADPSVTNLDDDPACRPGDINGNAQITAFDASLILQVVVGTLTPTEAETCAADFNHNGTITAFDASKVLQCVVGTGPCE
jgi:hypothetical protein